jgi:hypothetical protein
LLLNLNSGRIGYRQLSINLVVQQHPCELCLVQVQGRVARRQKIRDPNYIAKCGAGRKFGIRRIGLKKYIPPVSKCCRRICMNSCESRFVLFALQWMEVFMTIKS